MNARVAIVSLLLSFQLIVPMQVWSAPVSMDLSSTNATVAAASAGTIRVGGAMRHISVNQAITPAEALALSQVLASGRQTIVLGTLGNATGGSFSVSSAMNSAGISDIVVPKRVTGIDALSILNLSGNLSNSGKIYAVSTTPSVTTDIINATNIYNQMGALLTTVLPTAGLAGYRNAISGLNLTLNATNDIVNAGKISSAGSLTLTAGGSIINSLPGATGTAPSITAVRDLNITTNNLTNSGLLSSSTGNINLASQLANDLVINNVHGTISALKGNINLRDASFAGKYNLDLWGGTISTNVLNAFSGDGTITINVDKLNGVVNLTGGIGHVTANGGKLQLGQMNLTGDPTFYNTAGDIVLTSDMSFPGQDLAIIASGNIISQGCQVINTSSFNAGGQITLVAGAAFTTTSGNTSSLPPMGDTSSTLVLTGGNINGGKIDLASVPISGMSSVGTFNAGGNITLVAYGGSGAGAGTVALPKTVTVQTGSGGTDLNGNFTVFAGASTGNSIQVGGINTSGANNATGGIYMLTKNPSLSGCSGCTGNVQFVNGRIISGAFNTTPSQFPAPGNSANIIASDLSSSGASIQLLAGGTVSTGNITTSGSNSVGRTGTIAIAAGAASGNVINVGNLTTAGSTAASGNIVLITVAPTTLCSGCSYINLQPNTAGGIVAGNMNSIGSIDLRAGGDLTAGNLTSTGAGSTTGGQVGIIVDKNATMTNTFTVGSTGTDSVGTITVQPGTQTAGGIGISSNSTGGINASNQAALNIVPTSSGGGGRIGLSSPNGTLTAAGTWTLNATGAGQGGFVNLAGKTINFTNDLNISVNGAGPNFGENGGSVQITADTLNLPANAGVINANGSGQNGQGGSIMISSTTATTLGSGLTMNAIGSGVGGGGRATLGSNGTLNLGSGNVALNCTTPNGFGGFASLFGATTNQNGANLSMDVSSTGGGAGTVSYSPGALTATTGTTTLTANSATYNGGAIRITATTMNTGSGAFTANANGSNGFGGFISLNATNITSGSGALALNANGGLGGGTITANLDSYSGGANLAMNANGAGTQDGYGGVITVTAPGATDSLNVGSGAGQISMSANGYGADGNAADAGSITVSTGANLSIDGSGISAVTTAPNGNGAFLSFTAGTGGTGTMQLTGNINANAAGNGNAGTIGLSYASTNPLNSTDSNGTAVTNIANLSAQAPGTGSGGTITVSNTLSTAPVGLANNGTINVSSASGSAGSITIEAAGAPSAPTQDIIVTGSGSFVGPLTAIGRNVSFNMTGTAPFNVTNIQSVGGNLTMSIPNIVVGAGSTLSSSGTASFTTSSLTNNNTITSGGAMSFTNSGDLTVSGTGTLQGASLSFTSSAGAVNATQGAMSGTVGGNAFSSFSATANTGDLTVGSVNAGGGNATLVANGGNLATASGAVISATLGNVVLQDNATNGTITIGNGSTLTATSNTGTAGTGSVYVVLGPIPSSPIAGTAPAGMTVTATNNGQVYFGANGITNAGTSTATANGSNIVFSTGSSPATSITVNSSSFNATNQAVVVAQGGNPPPGQGGTPPGHGGTPPGQGGSPPPGHGGTPPGQPGGNITPGQGGTPPGLMNNTSASSTATTTWQTKKVAWDDEDNTSEDNYVPVAFVQPSANFAGAAIGDAVQTGKTETASIKQGLNGQMYLNQSGELLLKKGDTFIAAHKDTTVKAGACSITVSAGAIAHIVKHAGAVSVRNLYDSGNGTIIVKVGNHSIAVTPGHELVIAANGTAHTAMSQDKLGRRRVQETSLEDGIDVATAEFSLLSLVKHNPLVGAVFASNESEDKALSQKMMKLSVCLMTVTASHGAYSSIEP